MKSPFSFFRYLVIASLGFFTFIQADISYHTNPEKSLKKEGARIAKKYDLKVIGNGFADNIAGSKDGTWALSFTSDQPLTLEEARPIVADISYKLFHSFYHDPVYVKYYSCVQKNLSFLNKTMNDDEIGFRLAFWDKDVNRPLYPYLAQVRLADSKIYYHYADPETQALQPPIVESLESLKLPDYK